MCIHIILAGKTKGKKRGKLQPKLLHSISDAMFKYEALLSIFECTLCSDVLLYDLLVCGPPVALMRPIIYVVVHDAGCVEAAYNQHSVAVRSPVQEVSTRIPTAQNSHVI